VTDSATEAIPGESTGEPGQARRGRGREAAICAAALAVLAEVGYDRMSMDAVATRAHASKATIYRRWAGKRELVVEAVNSRHSSVPQPPDTGSLRGDVIATLRLMWQSIGQEDLDLMVGVLRAMRTAPDLADCVRENLIEEKKKVGMTLVDRAVARGELPPGADPEIFHETAPALVFFRVMVTGGPIDDAYLEHITDDVLVPLLARCGQGRTEKTTAQGEK
jgi:AcrR family transcriptional regulator